MDELNNIRNRLKKQRLSFTWLICQLRERGIVTDKTEVSSIFAGTRKGTKVDAIIKMSNIIMSDYEQSKVSIRDA